MSPKSFTVLVDDRWGTAWPNSSTPVWISWRWGSTWVQEVASFDGGWENHAFSERGGMRALCGLKADTIGVDDTKQPRCEECQRRINLGLGPAKTAWAYVNEPLV
jgi:hypothetical protein